MEIGTTITLKGISRDPYRFTLYPWGEHLQPISAVYVVLKLNHHGYQVLYIGSTSELRQHLLQHPKQTEFDIEGKTHIGVHVEPIPSLRHAKETDLVASYAPVLNMENDEWSR